MATLRIISKKLNIEMDKGGTFRPVFYILDENNAPVNLTGYHSVMQIKVDYSDVIPLFNLTTENSGISIVGPSTITIKAGNILNGVTLLADLVIAGVYGLKPHISADLTSTITQDALVYAVDLIEPAGDIIKYLRGIIKLNPDGTS
jgi:hypothetical protein